MANVDCLSNTFLQWKNKIDIIYGYSLPPQKIFLRLPFKNSNQEITNWNLYLKNVMLESFLMLKFPNMVN